MFCREVDERELAVKYFAGELGPEVRDEFEVHLLQCDRCRSSVEALQLTSDALAERAHEIRGYSRDLRAHPRWFWAATTATIVLVSALGVVEFPKFSHKTTASGSKAARDEAPRSGLNLEGQQTRGNSVGVAGANNNLDRAKTDLQVSREGPSTASSASLKPRNLTHFAPGFDSAESSPDTPSTRASPGTPKVAHADGPAPINPIEVSVKPASTEEVASAKGGAVGHSPTSPGDERMAQLYAVKPPTYAFSGGSATGDARIHTAFSTHPGMPSDTRSSALAQSLFRDAMLAYVEKRYSDAGSLLENAAKQAPGSTDINFFLGVCRLMNGPLVTDAIEPLEAAAMDKVMGKTPPDIEQGTPVQEVSCFAESAMK